MKESVRSKQKEKGLNPSSESNIGLPGKQCLHGPARPSNNHLYYQVSYFTYQINRYHVNRFLREYVSWTLFQQFAQVWTEGLHQYLCLVITFFEGHEPREADDGLLGGLLLTLDGFVLRFHLIFVGLQRLKDLNLFLIALEILLFVDFENEFLLLGTAHALDVEDAALRRRLLVAIDNDIVVQVLMLVAARVGRVALFSTAIPVASIVVIILMFLWLIIVHFIASNLDIATT